MTSCCDTTAREPETTAEIAAPSGRPRLDVVETSDAFRVDVEIPGAGKEDVELQMEKGVLSIHARVPSTNGTPGRYHVREHPHPSTYRCALTGGTRRHPAALAGRRRDARRATHRRQ